jgi:hypothetical protein
MLSAQKALHLYNRTVDARDMPHSALRQAGRALAEKFTIEAPAYAKKPSEYYAQKKGVETIAASEAVDAIEQSAKESIIGMLSTSGVFSDVQLARRLSATDTKQDFLAELQNYSGALKPKIDRFTTFLGFGNQSAKMGSAVTRYASLQPKTFTLSGKQAKLPSIQTSVGVPRKRQRDDEQMDVEG